MDSEAAFYDPLLHDVPLPLTGTFYALGFPVEIATNSPEVLAAACESWGAYGPEFDSVKVQLHVIVRPGDARSPEPVVRTQRQSFSLVADRDNFGAYDSASFFGYCYVSQATAGDHAWFRFHFLETMAYMLLAQRYVMPLHAACVARGERGILLYGRSGAGKSTLSWACAQAGWTYVTDDGAWLLPESAEPEVLGRCRQIRFKPDASRLFPELRDLNSRLRPDGKQSVEVPVADFPDVRTAGRCRIGGIVVLDRRAGANAELQAIDAAEVARMLQDDMPRYGEEVRARYQTAVSRLVARPCCRLIYDNLRDAVGLLTEFDATLAP